MSITRTHWGVNEVAFAWWAREKREQQLSIVLIGNILGRTEAAINTMVSDYRVYLRTGIAPNDSKKLLFPQVDLFLGKIQTEQYKEAVDRWEEKIEKYAPGKSVTTQLVIEKQDYPVAAPIESRYEKILEWLYMNDEGFHTKNDWRKAFMTFLKEIL